MSTLNVKVSGVWTPIAGDVSASNPAGDALAKNTNDLLRVGGTWRRNANQSIPVTTFTAITWDTELADTNGFLTPPNANIIIPTGYDAVYAISCSVQVGANAMVRLVVTGFADGISAPGDFAMGVSQICVTLPLVAGNAISAQVYNNTAAAINVTGRIDIWKVSN